MTALRYTVITTFIITLTTSVWAHPLQLCEIESNLTSLKLLRALRLSDEQKMKCRRISLDAQAVRERSLVLWRSYLKKLSESQSAQRPNVPLGGRVSTHVTKVKNLLSKEQLTKIGSFKTAASKWQAKSLDGEKQFFATLATVRQMSDGQWLQYRKDVAEKLRGQALATSTSSSLSVDEKVSKWMLKPSLYLSKEEPSRKTKSTVPSSKSWWKPKEKWQTIMRNDNAVLP